MRPRAVGLLALFFAASLSAQVDPSDFPARARAFASLPDWTGLWNTEIAAQLLATDRFTQPALWGKPPYNPASERAAGEAASVDVSVPASPDLPPTAKVCAPSGFPAVMEFPVPIPFELLVTPEQTVLVSADGTVRHIYTDGRRHPDAEELWATPTGHSIGRWEGEVLVVETIARTAGPVGPFPNAAALSEQARFTERIRLLDADTLENRLTIEDPARLSGPWNLVIRYARVRNLDRLIAEDCRENDRNPLVDGKFIIAPPERP